MINWIRSWFCSHEYEKHVNDELTTRVKSVVLAEVIYPYRIREAFIFCKKCGKTKKLN